MIVFAAMDRVNEIHPVNKWYDCIETTKLSYMKESIDKVLFYYDIFEGNGITKITF